MTGALRLVRVGYSPLHELEELTGGIQVKKVDLLLTSRHVTLVGREKCKTGINKGKMEEVIKR